MAEKILNTRLQLRIDTYANWTNDTLGENKGANLVLKRGEIGLCEIPSGNAAATTAPTVLFKVGTYDGENAETKKKFSELKWASALAADVYEWAKKPEAEFMTWLDETAGFATDAEVEEIRKTLAAADSAMAARIEALEDHVGGGENGVDATLADHETRIQAVESAVEDAANATQAELNAYKDEVSVEFEAVDEELGTLSAADAALGSRIDAIYKVEGETKSGVLADEITRAKDAETALGERIDGVITDYGTADEQVKTDLIGGDTDTTQAKTIAGAKAFATAAVNALNGQVNTNKADIAQLRTDLAAETSAREQADTALSNRLASVETFFETAEDETLDTALDTLKEIQDYLNGEGEATGGVISRVAQNEANIEALQDIVKDGGTLEIRVDNAEAAISRIDGEIDGHDSQIEALEAFKNTTVPATYETIANVDLVRTDVSNLKNLTSGTNGNAKLREDLTALGTRVSTAESTLNNTTATANAASAAATANAASIDNITKADGVIDTKIAALSEEGGVVKANADAIAALDTRVKANTDAIAALDSTYVSEAEFKTFKDTNTEAINAADAKATAAAARIDAYDERFGTKDDILVLYGGTSTTVI